MTKTKLLQRQKIKAKSATEKPKQRTTSQHQDKPNHSSEMTLGQAEVSGLVGQLGNRASQALLAQRQEAALMAATPIMSNGLQPGPGQVADSPERQLAQKIINSADRGGITISVYVDDKKPGGAKVKGAAEFKRQAVQYAEDHLALGLSGDSVQEGAAMQLTNSLPDTLQSLQNGIQSLLANHPDLTGHKSEVIPVRHLAIFTHGTRTGLQAGSHARWVKNTLADWVAGIAPFLSASPQVLLYACSVAGERAKGLPFAEELQLALQQELMELHVEDANIDPEVWGHTTAGHTTANPNLVELSGSDGAVAKDGLLSELSTKMTALYLERAEQRETLTDAQRTRVETVSKDVIRRTMRASTGRQSPTNVYMREIPQLGIDRVWQQLTSPETPDVSDLELSPEAVERLVEGVTEFREQLNSHANKLEKIGGPMEPPIS